MEGVVVVGASGGGGGLYRLLLVMSIFDQYQVKIIQSTERNKSVRQRKRGRKQKRTGNWYSNGFQLEFSQMQQVYINNININNNNNLIHLYCM